MLSQAREERHDTGWDLVSPRAGEIQYVMVRNGKLVIVSLGGWLIIYFRGIGVWVRRASGVVVMR